MHRNRAMMQALYRLRIFDLAHRDQADRTPFELAHELGCVAVCNYLRRLQDPEVAPPVSDGSEEEDEKGAAETAEEEPTARQSNQQKLPKGENQAGADSDGDEEEEGDSDGEEEDQAEGYSDEA
jgi:hypothetical protein